MGDVRSPIQKEQATLCESVNSQQEGDMVLLMKEDVVHVREMS